MSVSACVFLASSVFVCLSLDGAGVEEWGNGEAALSPAGKAQEVAVAEAMAAVEVALEVRGGVVEVTVAQLVQSLVLQEAGEEVAGMALAGTEAGVIAGEEEMGVEAQGAEEGEVVGTAGGDGGGTGRVQRAVVPALPPLPPARQCGCHA